jgi:hypothetical protein
MRCVGKVACDDDSATATNSTAIMTKKDFGLDDGVATAPLADRAAAAQSQTSNS